MKIQELNEDGSPRLDDNGRPIMQTVSDDTYYKLIETPIGRKRWRKVVIENKPVTEKTHKSK